MPMKKRYVKGIFALGIGSIAPSDSTDYYVAGSPGTTPVTSTGTMIFTMPEPGVIAKAQVSWYATTTAGSAEDVSCYIKVNGSTEYLVKTVSTNVKLKEFTNVNLAIPLSTGDYFEVLIRCPAWVINPDGVRIGGNIMYI